MAKKRAGGYNGKILRVNLPDNGISVETIDELFCRTYLGSAGFVAYFLWKELGAGIDPLGPDNKLIFALGPVLMLQYVGEGHTLQIPVNQMDYTVRMREFFDHHLKGKPAPRWLKEGIPHLKMKEHLKERAKQEQGKPE